MDPRPPPQRLTPGQAAEDSRSSRPVRPADNRGTGDPAAETEHRLVRRMAAGLEFARFNRYDDAAAVIEIAGRMNVWAESPDSWREAWEHLARAGFVPVAAAVRSGLITDAEACEPD